MSRISRHTMAMEIAEVAAKRATCYRLSVGCVILHDGRVVSLGYNGPPSGEPHCQGNNCPLSRSGGCLMAEHAEANAARFLKRSWGASFPTRVGQTTVYSTTFPCGNCAQLLIDYGFKRLVYRHDYRDMDASWALLQNSDMEVLRLIASGYLMNAATREILNE